MVLSIVNCRQLNIFPRRNGFVKNLKEFLKKRVKINPASCSDCEMLLSLIEVLNLLTVQHAIG